MNFVKIYRDFEKARASYDLETYCGALAQAGRASEIPPEAYKIAAYVHVAFYYVMKLLSDGDAAKAKFYMAKLAQDGIGGFDKFFYLLYLLGRILYATGDYLRAMKIFNRYEQIRGGHWGDVDELDLFYRATCAAMLGDFNAAARLYQQILTIKADFPEARQNLERVLRCSNQNLVLEVESIWNFPHWQDVPIFINARDRLGVMQRLIDWLLGAGYRNVIILDNASTYPPLLEYYATLERDSRIKIIRLGKNLGFKALWLSNTLDRLKISTPYIYTDPDVLPIERCPKDFVKRLMELLNANHEVRKVGLGLVYDDIKFFDKDNVQRTETAFYNGTQVGDNLHFAQVDTTLALYSNVRHYSLRLSLRTTGDLRAYHLPWYFDYDNLPEDERYYMEHADKNSVTSVKNFMGG